MSHLTVRAKPGGLDLISPTSMSPLWRRAATKDRAYVPEPAKLRSGNVISNQTRAFRSPVSPGLPVIPSCLPDCRAPLRANRVDARGGEAISSRWRNRRTMLHPRFRHLALIVVAGFALVPMALAPKPVTSVPVSSIDLRHPQITRQLSEDLAKAPPIAPQPAVSAGHYVPLVHQASAGPQREVFGFVHAAVMGDPT